MTSGSHCSVCGQAIVAQIVIPSLSEADSSDIVIDSGYYDDDEATHYNYSYSLTINDDNTFTLVTMIVGSDESFSLEYDTGRLDYETTLADGAIIYRLAFEREKEPLYIRINGNYFVFCNQDGSDLGEKSKERFEGATEVDITLPKGHNPHGYYDLANNIRGRDMQKLYRELLGACEEFAQNTTDVVATNGLYIIETIQLSDYIITPQEVIAVWKVFYGDNPEYYWLSNTLILGGNDFNLCIDVAYASASYRAECDQAIDQMVAELDAEITDGMSDLEKAKTIHDFVINRMDYAYENDGTTPQDDIWAHNMIGCAKYNWGVCESYAKTYLYLCLLNDVECLYVVGDAGEPHAWNLICLDGTWYGVDCTWDDTGTENISYSCFGMASAYLESTHTADEPSDRGIDYWYELPEVSTRPLELVDLYENGTFIGTYGNIDLAFEAMNSSESDYTIKFYTYEAVGPLLIAQPTIIHSIDSENTPSCNSLTIIGVKTDLGNGYFNTTDFYLNNDIVLQSDLIIENIALTGDGCLYIEDFSITTRGYYCSTDPLVSIIGNSEDTGDSSEIVVGTTYQTEFWGPVSVSKVTDISENHVTFRHNAQIINVTCLYVSIHGVEVIPIVDIDYLNCLRLSVTHNAQVSVREIEMNNNHNYSNTGVEILLSFGRLEEYPSITIGTADCEIYLVLNGEIIYVTTDINGNEINRYTELASPFNVDVPLVTLTDISVFEDMIIAFNSNSGEDIVKTHLYEVNNDGEIVLKAFQEVDGFVIMGTALVHYEGDETEIIIPDGVTSIGSGAFGGCTSLTNITIPNSVTRIDYAAFENCKSLTSITIPSSVTSIGIAAFRNCDNLTSVTFEEGSKLLSIGDEAFWNCTSLTSITIPSSVTSIGESAFHYCTSLIEVCNKSSLTIEAGSSSHGYVGYYAEHIITNEADTFLTNIDGYVFYDDGNSVYLVKYVGNDTELTLPNNFNGKEYAIWQYAFYGNYKITSITIPSNVTSIGYCAFWSCSSLTSVTFEEGSQLSSIGVGAFISCTSLTSITIPSSVTSIGRSAFVNCSNLTSVTFEEGSQLSSIGESAFSRCSSLTSITIPSSVTSIDHGAFYNCTSLTSVTFEDPTGWYVTQTQGASSGTSLTLTDPSHNAAYLKSYADHYWYKSN